MARRPAHPVDFDHPENAKVIAYLEAESLGGPRSAAPGEVDRWALQTHPDIVESFWDRLTALLPEPCQWVVHGSPVLVHPGSGIVFGLAGGTSTVALRLPEPELTEALRVKGYGASYTYPRQTIRASDFGVGWALVTPGAGEARAEGWCARAYEHAAATGRRASPS